MLEGVGPIIIRYAVFVVAPSFSAESLCVHEFNRHGLTRYIPADVRREVRRRSKFGCVICRLGFYQFEHIDPVFEDAEEHNPQYICCLCGSCHDAVTRGQKSKEAVAAAYEQIQNSQWHEVKPPVGPVDFHDGNAELLIGRLLYSPAVHVVVRYHGIDVIRVDPSSVDDEPGSISAVFTDDHGKEVLRLEQNAWIGSLANWDIEITGARISVRNLAKQIVLQLRLDPPGRIVVEHLDMRFGDAHLLATEETYSVGRILTGGSIHWVHAYIRINRCAPVGVAIEFTDAADLERRDAIIGNMGTSLATEDRSVVLNSSAGIMIKPVGIVIAGLCGSFDLVELSVGNQGLAEMRRVIKRHPEQIPRFISTGKLEASPK